MRSTAGFPVPVRPATLLALLLVLLAAGPAAAQRVEIAPYLGYRFGGELEADALGLFSELDVEFDDASSYGLIFDVRLTDSVLLELLLSRQSTSLETTSGFLGQTTTLFDIDVDTYHLGAIYEWAPGQWRLFGGGGLGATRFSPDEAALSSDTKFSFSLTGGGKVFVSEAVGFRFEGRFFATFIDEEEEVFCDPFGFCVRYRETTDLFQFEVGAGIVFRF